MASGRSRVAMTEDEVATFLAGQLEDIVEQQVRKRVAVLVTPVTVASRDHRQLAGLPGTVTP